jgi:mono/diheme cytochrome c family protein
MKQKLTLPLTLGMLAVMALGVYSCKKNNESEEVKEYTSMNVPSDNEAFQNHRDSVPTKEEYGNPLFVLSHDYPTKVKEVVNPSWQQALKGQPISESNVFAYMDSLKSYIAPNVKPFFTDNKNWTSAKYGWFNEPWVGSQREAILGAYLGNGNPANMFKSLKEDESGYALVFYDSVAAYTVGQLWGKTGQKVNLTKDSGQFKEGSVVVKLAFSNVNAPNWPVLKGAETFSVYDTIPTKENPKTGYQVRKVSFFQMDVIVKDSKAAPKTGWVYSTFVYDMDAKGTFWDKMVPLGAMWGDDPDVNSPIQPPYPKLKETIINQKAPYYSKETLGWGGRLSGPNDGAVAQEAVDVTTGKAYKNLALSSCMSCHSPAQAALKSFLLPGPKQTSNTLMVYTPGGEQWMRWFRDDYGNVPFDEGQIALDYDMAMAAKSIPAYNKAKAKQGTAAKNAKVVPEDKVTEANVEAFTKYRQRKTKR